MHNAWFAFEGEELAILATEGYRIFHDLPAQNNGRDFNIDHVVVGPTGLFAIETKTRRKGRTRPGFESHVVTYDGRQLIWPWGENRNDLDQAEAQARWLSGEINRLTGLGVAAKPILALPGWFVIMKAVGTVVVVNHKYSQVRAAIVGRGNRLLSEEQIDLVARQLDARCRDVAD